MGKKKSKKKSTPARKTQSTKKTGQSSASSTSRDSSPTEYRVLARRFRPQQFDEVVGQEAISQALIGAIQTQRVAHAYLFTGSRGVGKTSMARILAKALNCVNGPTDSPCDSCDICLSIRSGDDVDILEIDGASNRGIDEIRELRQNVGFLPSRTRYKVYIIDEVHMLTRDAFNALLKTLEEPPGHVKFIFCTTESHRIPNTILSRCQQFDFSAISPESIVHRLEKIVANEQVTAEESALETIARRACGSMRDSQSLLDQLLSLGRKTLSLNDVNHLLGTASETRLCNMGTQLISHDLGSVLTQLEEAIIEGVQVEQFVDQLIEFFRDLMILHSDENGPRLQSIASSNRSQLSDQAHRMGLPNIMAAIQILIDAKSRMRGTTHARTLIELALARIATLEDMTSLSEAITRLSDIPNAGKAPSRTRPAATSNEYQKPTQKKTTEPAGELPAKTATPNGHRIKPSSDSSESPESEDLTSSERNMSTSASPPSRSAEEPQVLWEKALLLCSDEMLVEHGNRKESLEWSETNQLVVGFSKTYDFSKMYCERPERSAELEKAIRESFNQKIHLRFATLDQSDQTLKPSQSSKYKARLTQSVDNPLVRKSQEAFQATIVRIDDLPHHSG